MLNPSLGHGFLMLFGNFSCSNDCSMCDTYVILFTKHNRKKINQILTLPNITPTKIKVSVDKNGKTRSVNLGNIESLSSTIDLDSPTLDKATGHVNIDYWLEQSDDIVDGMYDEIQAGLPRWKNVV